MLKTITAKLSAAIVSGCCILALSMSNMITAQALHTASTEMKTSTSESLLIGDVDSNAHVDALDASKILTEAALLGTGKDSTLTEGLFSCADVNGDSQIDAKDATLVLGYAAYTGVGGTDDFAAYLEQRNQADEEPEEPTESAEPEGNLFDLTEEEATMLAALVTLEGGSESFECQKAIASTVINRMLTSGSTLEGVIYEKNQFSTASKVASTTPFTSCVEAVDEVLTTGTTLPVYVTFFRASYYHSWGDQVGYCCIDNTYFSYSQALKNQYV